MSISRRADPRLQPRSSPRPAVVETRLRMLRSNPSCWRVDDGTALGTRRLPVRSCCQLGVGSAAPAEADPTLRAPTTASATPACRHHVRVCQITRSAPVMNAPASVANLTKKSKRGYPRSGTLN